MTELIPGSQYHSRVCALNSVTQDLNYEWLLLVSRALAIRDLTVHESFPDDSNSMWSLFIEHLPQVYFFPVYTHPGISNITHILVSLPSHFLLQLHVKIKLVRCSFFFLRKIPHCLLDPRLIVEFQFLTCFFLQVPPFQQVPIVPYLGLPDKIQDSS